VTINVDFDVVPFFVFAEEKVNTVELGYNVIKGT
jgi:hypothetical protein